MSRINYFDRFSHVCYVRYLGYGIKINIYIYIYIENISLFQYFALVYAVKINVIGMS